MIDTRLPIREVARRLSTDRGLRPYVDALGPAVRAGTIRASTEEERERVQSQVIAGLLALLEGYADDSGSSLEEDDRRWFLGRVRERLEGLIFFRLRNL